MTLTLRLIPTELVPDFWPQLSPYIEAAFQEAGVTEYGLAEAEQYLHARHWVAVGFFDEDNHMHGALTLCVLTYPHEKMAFVTAIGGRHLTNSDNWEQLRSICRNLGCSKLQAYSRESVARLWKRIGFSHRAILVEADL